MESVEELVQNLNTMEWEKQVYGYVCEQAHLRYKIGCSCSILEQRQIHPGGEDSYEATARRFILQDRRN